MRKFWEGVKVALAFIFSIGITIGAGLYLLITNFDETVTNIAIVLSCIISIILIYCVYCYFRTRVEINFIIDDVNETYNRGKYKLCSEIVNKNRIRELVYKKTNWLYKFKKVEPLFSNNQLNELLYKRPKHEGARSYTYNIINFYATFSDFGFSYELYDHCEKRVMDKDNIEHNYMRTCLNNVLMANTHLLNRTSCLRFLCQELLQIDCLENSLHLNRMVENIENARKNIISNKINFEHEKADVNELCDKYIEELKNYWEEHIRS